MPEICRFHGIIIRMFDPDHAPPHFHAVYAEHQVLVTIDAVGVYAGGLPPRQLGMVLNWAAVHQQELIDNWNELRQGRLPHKIRPLE